MYQNTRPSAVTRCLLTALGVALCFAGLAWSADYYVDPAGNDGGSGNGSQANPWKTVGYAIGQVLAGDTIHLTAGATFTGRVYIPPGGGGSASAPKTITSDEGNRAIIAPASNTEEALYASNTAGLRFENIRFVGPGMDTHQKNGVSFYADNGRHTRLEFANCEFTGFGKTGLVIGGWTGADRGFGDVVVEDCESHGNRRGGVSTFGEYASANTNVIVRRCTVYGNLGDPAATSHTGSGIVLGQVTDGRIEHCMAYGNGERCTTTGGPVGIWAFDSTRVTIQYCEAYSNRAAVCDGGGFDLDGGCQDCTIQYCYSHDNDGAGYLICQYDGARAYTGNTVRFCISENDGRRNGFGGIHFYSSGSNGGLQGTRIYGNTVFNSVHPVIWFQGTSGQSGTKIWNNLVVTTGGQPLVTGDPSTAVACFQGNAYWSSGGAFNVAGSSSLEAWRAARGQETLGGTNTGWAINPQLTDPGNGGLVGDTSQLASLAAYRLAGTSPLIDRGLNLTALFGVDVGGRDFYGSVLPQCRTLDIGAHESEDSDGDGLSDDWERHYFTHTTTANGTSHSDTDGATDLAEFEAGTNPTNSNSCFVIADFAMATSTNAVVSWSSSEGRQYALDGGADLLSGLTNALTRGVLATPPLNVHTCRFDAIHCQFFRVRLGR